MSDLSFKDYFLLKEALEFKNGGFRITADDGVNITLVQLFKDLKDNWKELAKFIIQNIKSHHFSPLVIIISMALAGINTQNFINKNPEVLNYGISQKLIDKVAIFLDKNPEALKLFQK